MSEMHLKQPGFICSGSGPFTKNKERIQKFKERRDSRHIYQNELDKACFQHDIVCRDFKDLTRRTASDKIWHDKAFSIAKNPKYDRYQRGLPSMVYKFSSIKSENISNKELAEELHKLIIIKFNKRKVHSPFIDNIWGTDLAHMQLISKFNKGTCFLLCVIDIFSKYAWVKKGITITNAFQNILKESNRKPNKIWIDKRSKFYNRSVKSWLKNNMELYSTHNEGKSVVAERFIRTLKNKIYKYLSPISKNLYIDKSDDIVNKYINTYHSTIKMKPVDIKPRTYIDSSKEINSKDP